MRLGYVFSRFPLLTETFILRELLELRRQGHRLSVCPLRAAAGRVRHARAARLADDVWFAPSFGGATLAAHGRYLARSPRRYVATLTQALWANRKDGNLLAGVICFWPKVAAIAAHFEREGVEHIHAHYATHPAFVAWAVSRLTGLPYSFTIHAHDLFCHRAMLPEKLREAAFVAPISRYNQAELRRACPSATPAPVIRCGVEAREYAPQARSGAGPVRLLAVGALAPYKGHAVLLDALALLPPGSVRLRLLGAGPLRRRLARQAARLGLAAMAELAGPATELEVRAALQWAQAFAMPSVREASGRMEGIPVALMEAMAAGLPVVASRLSGIPELVEDNVNGLLVEPGDAPGLAAALARLGEAALRRRLGAAARLRVAADYELAANVGRLAAWFAAPAAPELYDRPLERPLDYREAGA